MSTTRVRTSTSVPAARRPAAGAHASPSPPLRLRQGAADRPPRQQSLVDGAWWPYTDDLVVELEPLLTELARQGRVVHRISYCLGAWRPVPRKLQIAGTLVRLSGYRTQPAAVLHLVETSGRPPVVLVVVPPGTAPDVAEMALHLAVTSTHLDADGVLRAARAGLSEAATARSQEGSSGRRQGDLRP